MPCFNEVGSIIDGVTEKKRSQLKEFYVFFTLPLPLLGPARIGLRERYFWILEVIPGTQEKTAMQNIKNSRAESKSPARMSTPN